MKATNQTPAFGHLTRVEKMYKQMLIDLRGVIEATYGDLAGLAKSKAHGTSFQINNLYRVFSEENPQRMSLELYIRICAACNVGEERMKAQRVGVSNLALIDYLLFDNDIIWKSVTRLQQLGGAVIEDESEVAVYSGLVASIKNIIKKRYKSVDNFCKVQAEAGEGFERANLSRVLSAHNPQQMGLDMFVRLCGALGVGGERMAGQRTGATNIRLADYLSIDNDIINKSFTELQYSDFN